MWNHRVRSRDRNLRWASSLRHASAKETTLSCPATLIVLSSCLQPRGIAKLSQNSQHPPDDDSRVVGTSCQLSYLLQRSSQGTTIHTVHGGSRAACLLQRGLLIFPQSNALNHKNNWSHPYHPTETSPASDIHASAQDTKRLCMFHDGGGGWGSKMRLQNTCCICPLIWKWKSD